MRPTVSLILSFRSVVSTLLLWSAAAAAQAASCEELRSAIEDRIRGNGVQAFSVRVVEASASAPGRVVGTCDGGGRKIVYARPDSGADPAPNPSVRAANRRDVIITECRDGRVITSGSCSK